MADAKRKGMLRSRMLLFIILFLIGIATIVGVAWIIGQRTQPDMVEVMRLNNRGVGLMEQYEYAKAVSVFKEIVEKAPDWIPGQINLGIAQLNELQEPEKLGPIVELYRSVLKVDPRNPYAHYCIGICLKQQGDFAGAKRHFEKVVEIDNKDADSLWHVGEMYKQDGDYQKAEKYFQRALEQNPYHSSAIYGMALTLRISDEKRAKEFLDKHKALEANQQFNRFKIVYYKMGKYARVIGAELLDSSKTNIGPLPLFAKCEQFSVQLAEGTNWAAADDFGTDTTAKLRQAVWRRFGGTIAVLDFDQDNKLDLFLVGAVKQNGKVRDLLLHNEGNCKFKDVTSEAGLSGNRPSLGCAVSDFNNDGFPDLVVTGAGVQHLFRNVAGNGGGRRFEDVTRDASLHQLNSVCLGAMWMDLDQDSDSDLVLAQYAETVQEALDSLNGKSAKKMELAVFYNVGVSPPNSEKAMNALSVSFLKNDSIVKSAGQFAGLVNVAGTDLERDRDVDFLVIGGKPALMLNDRLAKFRRVFLPEEIMPNRQWNGAIVFNCNKDKRSDLLLLGPKKKPLFLINQQGGGEKHPEKWFKRGAIDAPALLHGQTLDVDLDGWFDIVGLSENRLPVLLHNDGERLTAKPSAFGANEEFGKDLIAACMADINGDCHPDLLVWSESKGLLLKKNLKNTNHAVHLTIRGHRLKAKSQRCNADGFGAFVMVQSGSFWTAIENTTLSGGLAQSRPPLLLGLAKATEAEVVRVRWPDGTIQGEVSIPHCHPYLFKQINREPISCPLLFTWNGERFVFVTDILGAGAMGEMFKGGNFRQPRPHESIKIEANQLAPRDGKYQLIIAEPKDEVTYLDQAQLVVVDHPNTVEVYPDERFVTSPKGPSQDILVYKTDDRIFPNKVIDHCNRDVTALLREKDRRTVDRFATRSWLGYAEDHWIEIDFGDRLARTGPTDPLVLCLYGWTAYPYPEAMWAAEQAKIALEPPILQRRTNDGKWEIISPELGFPAGYPRMMTVDVTGKLTGPSCALRIRTNMQVYWDQIFVAPLVERVSAATDYRAPKHIRVNSLAASHADLYFRGFVQEFTQDGRQPTMFDYDRLERIAVPRITGRFTRFGKIGELLQERDDQFVIMGPGEEISISFEERMLTPLRKGWKRSFVLRVDGYSKACGPFTAEEGTTFPLPFHGMSNFPYRPDEHYPNTPAHREYLRRYLTRHVGPMRP